MKLAAYLFAVLCAAVVVGVVAMYGYSTGDTELSRATFGFFYGMIACGALFGHAVMVRLWRHGFRVWPVLLFPILAGLLVVNLSNSLGAFASRGVETRAEASRLERMIEDDRRALALMEKRRAEMRFEAADAATVAAAQRAADAAAESRQAECARRGPECRAREVAERAANDRLAAVTASAAATDRAATLDAEIGALRARIAEAGPVRETNAQGVAFANLFALPRTAADWLATWQNLIMALAAEVLIVSAFISAELLPGRQRKPPAEVARNSLPADNLEPAARPAPIATEPRMIEAPPPPTGRVIPILADILEPGPGAVEFTAAYGAYRDTCMKLGRKPVPPTEFADELTRLCKQARIKVQVEDGTARLLRVQIKAA